MRGLKVYPFVREGGCPPSECTVTGLQMLATAAKHSTNWHHCRHVYSIHRHHDLRISTANGGQRWLARQQHTSLRQHTCFWYYPSPAAQMAMQTSTLQLPFPEAAPQLAAALSAPHTGLCCFHAAR